MHLGARGIRPRRADRPRDRRRDRARRRRRAASSCSPTSATARRRCCASAPATTSRCARARARAAAPSPRVRCIGRTDDMLIVRGVNVFPSAVREVVSAFAPDVSGHILVRPQAPGRQAGAAAPGQRRARRATRRPTPELADAIRARLRSALVVQTRVELVPWGSLAPQRVQVETRRDGEASTMRKLQSQGVHHITLVGADRQTSIDFWEGVLGMPFVFEQPNLDNPSESHLYFDPGDGRLITIFTNEERVGRPEPHPDRSRLRAPHRASRSRRRPSTRRSSGSTSAGSATAASRTAASWTRSTSRIRSVC